jgi:hypothetical protein
MPGARRTHSLACESKKARRVSHHRYNAINRHSLRDGFNAYFVLSPVTGLFCHRRLRNTFRQLDASVGASGPHDFAVRFKLRSSTRRQSVHRIPRPTSVTIAIRPSCGNGMAEISGGDLPDGTSEIFLQGGLDDPNHVERPQQFAVYAHAISRASGPRCQAALSQTELICPDGQIGWLRPSPLVGEGA